MGKLVNVTQDGKTYSIPEEQVPQALEQGFHLETAEEAGGRVASDVKADVYGGLKGKLAAAALGAARGATLGLSDVALTGLGVGEDVKNYREQNPGLSTVGELGGAIASAGTSLPGGLATKAGGAIAHTAEGAGAITSIGRAAAGGAVEGAIYGAGQGVSDLALSDDPLTFERAASVLSSNMLFGGATGGIIGAGGKALEKGMLKAKGALDEVAARGATPEIAEDLSQLDAKGLRAAKEAELGKLVEAQKAERVAAVGDVDTYVSAVKDANPWLAINEGEEAALLKKSRDSLRTAMNDPVGLRENPSSLLKPLRVQEQAFERALANREAMLEKLTKANTKIATDLEEQLGKLAPEATELELTGKAAKRYGQFADVKVGKAGVTITRDEAAGFLDAIKTGKVRGAGEQAFGKLDGLLEQNRALQARIKGSLTSKAELASPRLSAIADAEDVLKMPAPKKSIAEDMASGVIFGKVAGMASGVPVLGPLLGAKAARLVTDAVFGRMGKLTAEQAARGSAAIERFLGTASKAGRVAKAAPVLAPKVLSSLSYAPKAGRATKAGDLANSYRARSEEIRSQTMYAPDGSHVMRPTARAEMAARLAPLRAAHPVLADRVETLAARRIEYLASQLPKEPEINAMRTGPETYKPPAMEMRRFARLAAAAEDPHAVLHRLADGSITAEDVEAMKACYPALHQQYVNEITAQLPALRKSLPTQKRVALSIFSGVAVDPAMDPGVLSVLQRSFKSEPGSAGGMQAPTPQPQFGSVKKSVESPTPAQHRAG